MFVAGRGTENPFAEKPCLPAPRQRSVPFPEDEYVRLGGGILSQRLALKLILCRGSAFHLSQRILHPFARLHLDGGACIHCFPLSGNDRRTRTPAIRGVRRPPSATYAVRLKR